MPPLSSWLRNGLKGFCRDVLLDPRTRNRGWLQYKTMEGYLTRHEQGESRLASRLWNLIVLEEWARAFMDGQR